MSLLRQDFRPIYTIDADDRLVEVNHAFCESFGVGRTETAAHALIGRPIWDFVTGAVSRQIWEVLYDRVRAVGAPVFVPLRADTASQRSLIDLELHPLSDRSIRHVCEYVLRESRPAIALLDPNYPRDDRALLRCAWCARVQVRLGLWQEVEDALISLRLQATETLPQVRDASCGACTQSVLKTFPARVA
jgi:hypothetical protein